MPSRRLSLTCLILAALTGSGVVLAGEPDPLMPRLVESPLLTLHFSHLDAPPSAGLSDLRSEPSNFPVVRFQQQQDPNRALLSSALAIEWQHQLNGSQRFSLSAQYRDQVQTRTDTLNASGNSAAFGWSQQVSQSSLLSSQLYLGDEGMKDRASGYSNRRYYGLAFEGRYSLWRDHTPFASLSWQRNEYDTLEPVANGNGAAPRSEGVSRFIAGWTWQVTPVLNLRAEAQYRLTDEVFDPSEQDRLQFYFRSRYGFR
jgi:hypothetical protein